MVEKERSAARGARRRDVLKYTGAGLATTSLAGCMSYLESSDGGGGGGRATGTAPDKFKDETFKLGLLTAPPNTAFGSAMINSAKMAANEVSGEGVLGGNVEIVTGNTQLQSAKAKREYQRLVREEDVDMTMGTLSGDSLRAILRPMSEAQIIHNTTASAEPRAAKLVSKQVSVQSDPEEEYEAFKYHFRSGPINTQDLETAFGEFMDLYLDELGWSSVGILIEDGPGSQETVENVRKQTPDRVDVPYAKAVSALTTSWKPIYDELERKGVDVALVVQVLSGQSSVVQWAAQERPFALGGIHVRAQLPTFFKETGGAAEGVFTMNAVTPQTTNTPHTQEFMKKYRQQFGGVPFFAGPITYDAVKQMAAAIRRKGLHPKDDVDKFVNYWESPEFVFTEGTVIPAFGFRGPDERFAHDPIWDCMTNCDGKLEDDKPAGPTGVPVWQQWQRGDDGGGVMESIAPESNKTAEYQKPPWMR